VEVRFTDESDFVIYGEGFILKDDADNLDWEVFSSISLEWNDSLDEISDFEEELRSGADSDPGAGAGPSAPNIGGRKKPKARSKQRAGNVNRRKKESVEAAERQSQY